MASLIPQNSFSSPIASDSFIETHSITDYPSELSVALQPSRSVLKVMGLADFSSIRISRKSSALISKICMDSLTAFQNLLKQKLDERKSGLTDELNKKMAFITNRDDFFVVQAVKLAKQNSEDHSKFLKAKNEWLTKEKNLHLKACEKFRTQIKALSNDNMIDPEIRAIKSQINFLEANLNLFQACANAKIGEVSTIPLPFANTNTPQERPSSSLSLSETSSTASTVLLPSPVGKRGNDAISDSSSHTTQSKRSRPNSTAD